MSSEKEVIEDAEVQASHDSISGSAQRTKPKSGGSQQHRDDEDDTDSEADGTGENRRKDFDPEDQSRPLHKRYTSKELYKAYQAAIQYEEKIQIREIMKEKAMKQKLLKRLKERQKRLEEELENFDPRDRLAKI